MMTNVWLYLLLTVSLILTVLTLIGYRRPTLVRAKDGAQVLRRHGAAALLSYLLMALLLSVHDIDQRGYDRQFDPAPVAHAPVTATPTRAHPD